MIASFYYTIVRDDEDVDVLVEYEARRYGGEVDIDLRSVTLDGVKIETSGGEDRAIMDACFDRVDEDYQAEEDSYADYRYEQRRDDRDED